MLLPLYNNARKVPARGSWQSCFLEVAGDIPDVAGVDRCRLHANECFLLARLRNRDFFDAQDRRRSKLRKTQRFHSVGTHRIALTTPPSTRNAAPFVAEES